jgi:hypothetical protein
MKTNQSRKVALPKRSEGMKPRLTLIRWGSIFAAATLLTGCLNNGFTVTGPEGEGGESSSSGGEVSVGGTGSGSVPTNGRLEGATTASTLDSSAHLDGLVRAAGLNSADARSREVYREALPVLNLGGRADGVNNALVSAHVDIAEQVCRQLSSTESGLPASDRNFFSDPDDIDGASTKLFRAFQMQNPSADDLADLRTLDADLEAAGASQLEQNWALCLAVAGSPGALISF